MLYGAYASKSFLEVPRVGEQSYDLLESNYSHLSKQALTCQEA